VNQFLGENSVFHDSATLSSAARAGLFGERLICNCVNNKVVGINFTIRRSIQSAKRIFMFI
jgi:hypothetical protein